jgi:hypothetical protein
METLFKNSFVQTNVSIFHLMSHTSTTTSSKLDNCTEIYVKCTTWRSAIIICPGFVVT